MESQSDANTRQSDIRASLDVLRNSFTPPLAVIIDPRVPRLIPQDGAALSQALRELSHEIEILPNAGALCLVVYELDDPGRRLLRFELPGTQLGFTLPISDDHAVLPETSQVDLAILVAEDNPINQQLAVECLRNLGCECRLVGDGAAAVEAAGERPYDLIFMDIHMPVMDGFSATRAIRRLPDGIHPYIAALTAYAMPGGKIQACEAGMDDYITKPCRIESLSAVLKKARARNI